MTPREIRLDLVLNRRVRDIDGRVVGRLEEAIAHIRPDAVGNHYEIREFHLGKYALLEALAGGQLARAVLRFVGGARAYRRFRVPWDWMDLSDPERPRLTRTLADVEAASIGGRAG